MNIIIALIPALGWGLFPLVAEKIKNSHPTNEMMGLGMGALIIAIIAFIIQTPQVGLSAALLSMVSGIFWSIGQGGQFLSISRIGISKTMPLSTGFQLIGNTLIGAIIFGEWKTTSQYLIGTLAIVLIIIGVTLTALTEDKSARLKVKDVLLLLCTSIGYWVYSSFPKAVKADAQSLFLPQTIGIFIGCFLILVFTRDLKAFKQKSTYKNIISGLLFGIGALAYIFSAKLNGVITAFIYSQICVVISTLGGIFIIGENKTKGEFIATIFGLVLIIVGAAIQ